MDVIAPPGKGARFRWIICGLLFSAVVLSYIDRLVLSVLKPTLQEAGQKVRDTARTLKGTAQEQMSKTRDAVKGGGSMSSSSLGGTETSSYNLGGSSTRSTSGQGSEMPDISRTPLAESPAWEGSLAGFQ